MVPDVAIVSNPSEPKTRDVLVLPSFTWICQTVRSFAALLHLNMYYQLQKNSPISSHFPKKNMFLFQVKWLEEAWLQSIFWFRLVEAVGG